MHACYEVDRSSKFAFSTNRNLDGYSVDAHPIENLLVYLEEIRTSPIHLIHKDDPWYFVAIGLSPYRLRLRLNTANGAKYSNYTIEYPHRTFDFDREVYVSWSIDDIDLVILPSRADRGGGDGDSTLLLLHHPVGGGSSFVNFANFVDNPRII